MLVLDAFKGHLILYIKTTITGSSMNTDLVIKTPGMTSQLQMLHVVFKVNASAISCNRSCDCILPSHFKFTEHSKSLLILHYE